MPGVAHYYDLSYRLRRPYWGQGIATEAAMFWLQYGFELLQLPEIGAVTHVDNIGSNTILRKIGLRFKETFQYDEETQCNWYALEPTAWKKINLSVHNKIYEFSLIFALETLLFIKCYM